MQEVPHRRIGSHAIVAGKHAYDQSPKSKGISTQSGNLYGKKQSAIINASSTSVGNTTDEVRQMLSGQNS